MSVLEIVTLVGVWVLGVTFGYQIHRGRMYSQQTAATREIGALLRSRRVSASEALRIVHEHSTGEHKKPAS